MTVWLLICVGIIGLNLLSTENTRSGLYTYNKVQKQNYNLQMRRNNYLQSENAMLYANTVSV